MTEERLTSAQMDRRALRVNCLQIVSGVADRGTPPDHLVSAATALEAYVTREDPEQAGGGAAQ